MKAYRGEYGRLRLFRPDRNMARMLSTAKRSSLPSFDADEMIKCMKRLFRKLLELGGLLAPSNLRIE